MTWLLHGTVAGTSAGLGCGTCCGSGISAFLFGYLTTHTRGIRQSVLAFLSFYLGKTAAVTALCITASMLGTQIMDEQGTLFGGINIHLAAKLMLGGMAVWMIVSWIKARKTKGCAACGHCRGTVYPAAGHSRDTYPDEWNPRTGTKANVLMLWLMGSLYGISPCAPLILMLGYAAAMPVYGAALTGAVFALSSAVAPTVFLLVLSGVLSREIVKEAPEYLDWFRLAVYVLLLGIVLADFL